MHVCVTPQFLGERLWLIFCIVFVIVGSAGHPTTIRRIDTGMHGRHGSSRVRFLCRADIIVAGTHK